MPLRLVPKTELTGAQAVIERVKQRPKREPGTLQCNRCGGRDTMTVVSGAWIDEAGKLRRGTVTSDKVCYHCDKKGVLVFMVPEAPRLVRPKEER